jgi:hypothetical protein
VVAFVAGAPLQQLTDPQLAVHDLGPGLWIWRIRHPNWTEDADWQPVVTSICADVGAERLILDPLAPPPDARAVWDRLDARPPTAVCVLIPDHVRPCSGASEAPTSVDLLVRRYGCPTYSLAAGMALAGGAVVLPDPRGFDETPLWLPDQRVIVFADALTERNGVLRTWTIADLDGRAARALRDLLALPFERVIIAHGEPVHARAAFERALELPPWPAGPLHLYAWKGELDVVRRLVEQGADLAARDEHDDAYLRANGISGHTALDWARANRQRAVIAYLESIGAPGS